MTGHKSFELLRKEVRKDPDRAKRVRAHKAALNLGLDLAAVRASRNKTQKQLATAMGVSQANISRIEHGEDAYLSTLQHYAEALGGTLDIRIVFPNHESDPTEPTKQQARALPVSRS